MAADLPRRLPTTPRLQRWWHRRLAWRRRPTAPVAARDAWRGGQARHGRGRGHRYRAGLRRWPRRTVIGIITLAVLAVLVAVATFAYGFWRYHELDRTAVAGLTSARSGAPFNMLIVGTDPIGTSTSTGGHGFATTSGRRLAEVVMVARVDPKTHSIRVIAIPSDTTVAIASPSTARTMTGPIADALEAGPAALVQTIDADFSIPLNDYVALKLSGVKSVVAALGGVHLEFAYPVRDDFSGLAVDHSGCQLVSGAQAQALFVSRHLYYFSAGSWRADLDGSSSAIARQDAVFAATLTSSGGILFDPVELNNLVSSVVANLTIDNRISESRLLSLADTFRGFPRAELSPATLPTVAARSDTGRGVVAPAVGPDDALISRFLAFGTASTAASLRPSVHVALAHGISAGPRAPAVDRTLHTAWNPSPC